MEHECDEDFFHDDKTTYNYSTAPGERWNCSKIFIFEGRGYIKDYLSACGERLYLKCRRCQKKPHPCRGRAMIVGKFGYVSVIAVICNKTLQPKRLLYQYVPYS